MALVLSLYVGTYLPKGEVFVMLQGWRCGYVVQIPEMPIGKLTTWTQLNHSY